MGNFKESISAVVNNIFTLIISIALIVSTVWLGFKANGFYNDFVEIEKKLEQCKEVPDIKIALLNVSEYVGSRRKIYFKTECRNTKKFKDFYDNNNKCKDTLIDVTDVEGFSLSKDDYSGTFAKSKYVVQWIEYWNFYYDLSEEEDLWKVNSITKTILFNSPEIKVSRTSKSQDYSAHTVDLALWSSNPKSLLKMTLKTDEFGEQKAKEYLEQAASTIQKEMEESLKGFIKDFLRNFGYAEYDVKFNSKIKT